MGVLAWLAGSKIGRGVLGVAVIAFFIVGFRIWLAAHDASVAREATSTMVTKFERDSLASQLAEEKRRRLIADQLIIDASKRAEAALQAKSKAEADLEARIAADTGPDGGKWSEEDERWNGRR